MTAPVPQKGQHLLPHVQAIYSVKGLSVVMCIFRVGTVSAIVVSFNIFSLIFLLFYTFYPLFFSPFFYLLIISFSLSIFFLPVFTIVFFFFSTFLLQCLLSDFFLWSLFCSFCLALPTHQSHYDSREQGAEAGPAGIHPSKSTCC